MKMHTRYEHQGFCESNKKQVFTFISPTKASVSTSIVAKPGMPSLWMDHLETEVVITGGFLHRHPVFRGREAGFALEKAAEGGLIVETQHVGDSLHIEVGSHAEQFLGLAGDL